MVCEDVPDEARAMSPLVDRAETLALAAEDDGDRGRWVCDLLRAAGRSGVILRTPSPNLQMMELRCVYGDEPLKLGCCVVGHAVLVRTLDRDEGAGSVWNSNLQPEFNVRVCDIFDATSSAVLRELDESNRFVQKSAESTSI